MSGLSPESSAREAITEAEVRRRVKEMRNDELIDFVRETVLRLDALADRLERFAEVTERDNGGTPNA